MVRRRTVEDHAQCHGADSWGAVTCWVELVVSPPLDQPTDRPYHVRRHFRRQAPNQPLHRSQLLLCHSLSLSSITESSVLDLGYRSPPIPNCNRSRALAISFCRSTSSSCHTTSLDAVSVTDGKVISVPENTSQESLVPDPDATSWNRDLNVGRAHHLMYIGCISEPEAVDLHELLFNRRLLCERQPCHSSGSRWTVELRRESYVS